LKTIENIEELGLEEDSELECDNDLLKPFARILKNLFDDDDGLYNYEIVNYEVDGEEEEEVYNVAKLKND
jgi:hypothetical protein